MLLVAAYLLGVASLGGLLLFALYGRVRATGRIWIPGAVHGAFGLAGALVMLPGLGETTRNAVSGTGSFARLAAVLIAVAAIVGVLLLGSRLRQANPPSVLIGIHATAAVAGLVLLAAYLTAAG